MLQGQKLSVIGNFCFCIGLILLTSNCSKLKAQDADLLQKLNKELAAEPTDSNRAKIVYDIAWEFIFTQADTARILLQQSLEISEKVNYKTGIANANNGFGVSYAVHGPKASAIPYFKKALKIREELQLNAKVASMHNNIGNLYSELDSMPEAFEHLHKSLFLKEALKDTAQVSSTLYNIAVLHKENGNYEAALEYTFKCLENLGIKEDVHQRASCKNLLGNVKEELGRWDEALIFYQEALELFKTTNDNQFELVNVYLNIGSVKDALAEKAYKEKNYKLSQPLFEEAIEDTKSSLVLAEQQENDSQKAAVFNNLGAIYKNLGSFYYDQNQEERAHTIWLEALDFFKKSEQIRLANNNTIGLMEVNNGIGDIKRRQTKYQEAISLAEKTLAMALEQKHPKFEQDAYKDLAKAYAKKGDFKNAYLYREKYDELKYLRLNEKRVVDNDRREQAFGDHKMRLEREKENILHNSELQRASIIRNSLIGGAIALLLLAGLLFNRNRIKNKANIALENKNSIIAKEQKRSEELLLNILPAATAAELKDKGSAAARQYDSVTVLFTDFVSFTNIAEHLSPTELVAELDQCFRAFDEITERHGIEKIKTIGDAYMCAGGLPVINKTHPLDVVKAALEIQEFMKAWNLKKGKNAPVFETRIGIHTGPVVAGIVGSKKFAYDIWGDTVNMAARMESSGAAGMVNISQSTYELVQENFECEHRGKIEAKNKGKVDMYFVQPKHEKSIKNFTDKNLNN